MSYSLPSPFLAPSGSLDLKCPYPQCTNLKHWRSVDKLKSLKRDAWRVHDNFATQPWSMASFRLSAEKLRRIKRLKYTIASRFSSSNSADTNSSFFKLHADDKAKVRVLNYYMPNDHTHARISFSARCSEFRFSLLVLCFNTICELNRIDSQRFYTFAQKLYSNNFVRSLTGLSPTAIVNLCFLSGKKNQAIPQPLRPIFWEVCLIVFPFLTFLTSIIFSTEVVRNLGAVLKSFRNRTRSGVTTMIAWQISLTGSPMLQKSYPIQKCGSHFFVAL